MRQLITAAILFATCAFAQNTCVDYPQGVFPFSSVAYVTGANSAGDHLVVGLLNGPNAAVPIPIATQTNQLFCDPFIALAPQQFYSNVYVPTVTERNQNFSPFAGLLVDPINNQP